VELARRRILVAQLARRRRILTAKVARQRPTVELATMS
jgi:hypothetical protein